MTLDHTLKGCTFPWPKVAGGTSNGYPVVRMSDAKSRTTSVVDIADAKRFADALVAAIAAAEQTADSMIPHVEGEESNADIQG